MTDLAGSVAVVTGAAVGSGRPIAERLAAEGADVRAADIDAHGGEESLARIAGAGPASSAPTCASRPTSRRSSPPPARCASSSTPPRAGRGAMITAMRRVNLHTAELTRDDEPAGYEHAYLKLAPLIGGATMNGGYYELPPGQANCPYHYESDEEWLLVLEGRITVRHPGGEDTLEAGDLVCFPGGPDGAHKLTNGGDGTARMLIVSTNDLPAVAVYPDSDKIGVWTEGRRDNIMVRRESGVDYYDGEV